MTAEELKALIASRYAPSPASQEGAQTSSTPETDPWAFAGDTAVAATPEAPQTEAEPAPAQDAWAFANTAAEPEPTEGYETRVNEQARKELALDTSGYDVPEEIKNDPDVVYDPFDGSYTKDGVEVWREGAKSAGAGFVKAVTLSSNDEAGSLLAEDPQFYRDVSRQKEVIAAEEDPLGYYTGIIGGVGVLAATTLLSGGGNLGLLGGAAAGGTAGAVEGYMSGTGDAFSEGSDRGSNAVIGGTVGAIAGPAVKLIGGATAKVSAPVLDYFKGLKSDQLDRAVARTAEAIAKETGKPVDEVLTVLGSEKSFVRSSVESGIPDSKSITESILNKLGSSKTGTKGRELKNSAIRYIGELQAQLDDTLAKSGKELEEARSGIEPERVSSEIKKLLGTDSAGRAETIVPKAVRDYVNDFESNTIKDLGYKSVTEAKPFLSDGKLYVPKVDPKTGKPYGTYKAPRKTAEPAEPAMSEQEKMIAEVFGVKAKPAPKTPKVVKEEKAVDLIEGFDKTKLEEIPLKPEAIEYLRSGISGKILPNFADGPVPNQTSAVKIESTLLKPLDDLSREVAPEASKTYSLAKQTEDLISKYGNKSPAEVEVEIAKRVKSGAIPKDEAEKLAFDVQEQQILRSIGLDDVGESATTKSDGLGRIAVTAKGTQSKMLKFLFDQSDRVFNKEMDRFLKDNNLSREMQRVNTFLINASDQDVAMAVSKLRKNIGKAKNLKGVIKGLADVIPFVTTVSTNDYNLRQELGVR